MAYVRPELHRLRASLTHSENGLKILDTNYHRDRSERVEKIARVKARIAELEAEKKAETEVWEDAK